ncbi:MAG: hypothetical protein sL5_09180 [Candidatus Mesenet longicola]|uniref:Uncharacterized protein n=1 Tax=Candidatus Mesenet longicola TaxID=1892558 RepID=A0A8J3HVJ4_9RICK|nr:MAG: hypothetical protein sGL2_07070 [Candidatus Mesenet longicola]GHM59925.1 MAG: hypothetical protein sL5_09180 [Candidatus Mesenet longicola]
MTENNNIKTCDKYEEYFEGLNNICKDLDELKKSFDDELICIQKSVKEDKKSYPIFQDDKAFDVFRKLCKLKLLDIVKDTFKLTKHDIKAINKVIEQDRLNINAQDVHHLYKLADKFTKDDIQYLEKVASMYEKESIEQLNKTEASKTGSIKSLFTRIFKTVIRKLQHGEKLVELKSKKEQQSSFISHLPEKSLNDLTDFNFAKEEHKLENSSTKMDAKSNLIDLNTNFDQVTITEINNKQLSQ